MSLFTSLNPCTSFIVCMCVCAHTHVYHGACVEFRGQLVRGVYSLWVVRVLWVLRIEFRSLGLGAGTFNAELPFHLFINFLPLFLNLETKLKHFQGLDNFPFKESEYSFICSHQRNQFSFLFPFRSFSPSQSYRPSVASSFLTHAFSFLPRRKP